MKLNARPARLKRRSAEADVADGWIHPNLKIQGGDGWMDPCKTKGVIAVRRGTHKSFIDNAWGAFAKVDAMRC